MSADPLRITGNPEVCPSADSQTDVSQKLESGKFAEIDADECLKADKSQERFRHIIDF